MSALSTDVLVRLVLAVLAVWRVTHLLASEDGPGGVIFHVRRRLGGGWLGELADCFNCLSLFVGAPAALFVSRQPIVWAVSWLALSGAACLLERLGHAPPLVDPFAQPEKGEADVLRFETRDAPAAPDTDPRAARGSR